MAYLSALLAYGKVDLFMGVLSRILESCDGAVLDLVQGRCLPQVAWPGYRLSTGDEIARFARAIGAVIERRGSLEASFMRGWKKAGREAVILDGFRTLRQDLLAALAPDPVTPGLRHLLPDPDGGGVVKRLCMFLRWMVRPNDGLDLGLWKKLPTSALVIPVDRHITRLARNLGLVTRKTDDWKTALEITSALARFDAKDPVKYDFALCHLGISGTCTHGRDLEACAECGLVDVCQMKHQRRI